jgi:hypothetical protein
MVTWLLAICATAALLYSFMYDTDATLRSALPKPYRYELLVGGLASYIAAYVLACIPKAKAPSPP